MRRIWLAVLGTALLGGCSSVVEGWSQEITINTTPPGANCTLNREGAPIAKVESTPGSVTIAKTRQDIEVVCELDGYQKTAYLNESGTAAAVFGNILIGGAIGLVVDMSTGASNKYDTPLDIALTPQPASPEAPLPVVASAPLLPPPPAVRPVRVGPAPAAVDLRRAQNAAERYGVLRRLMADGLVPEDRYAAWAQQNAGAFLLTTVPPPFAAVGNKPPRYEDVADFLRKVGEEKNLKVAAAEREALFRSLMPMEGARAKPLQPPTDAQGLLTWYAFLDRLGDDGLLSAQSIEEEKAAINDARIVAG